MKRKKRLKWYKDTSLVWVNELRVICGLEPLEKFPKGDPAASNLCPLALALPGGSDHMGSHMTSVALGKAEFRDLLTIDLLSGAGKRLQPVNTGCDNNRQMRLPYDVHMFAQLFDLGMYPKLERG